MNTYVANCTQQNHILNFRLPDSRKPLSYKLPMGKQLLVGDLTPPEVDALVEQLGPYGLIGVGEITNAKGKITYVMSQGVPVKSADILRALDKNNGVLRDEGKHRREEAAVAANAGMNTDDTPLNKLEMSIEEDTSGSFSDGDKLAEGMRIDNTQSTSENKKPRQRSKRGG